MRSVSPSDAGFPVDPGPLQIDTLPSARLTACVAIPAHNEAAVIGRALTALAHQRDGLGRPLPPESFEVIVLANNCRDRTAAVARRAAARFPRLVLHVPEINFSSHHAHVGWARRLVMDLAARRLHEAAERSGCVPGAVLTTDADTVVAHDWIAATLAQIAAGCDAVGGRLTVTRRDLLSLPPLLRRNLLRHRFYERLARRIGEADAGMPLSDHTDRTGASLAITAALYRKVGGLPPIASGEDVALHRAIIAASGRFRHSAAVRVSTSARLDGRAGGGMAETLSRWQATLAGGDAIMVPTLASLRSGSPIELEPLDRVLPTLMHHVAYRRSSTVRR